jgi:Lysozyme like domain
MGLLFVLVLGVLGYEAYQNGWFSNLSGVSTGLLTASQIASYASNAGWAGNDVAIATAIALAESGGNPDAYNPEGSIGIWQIDIVQNPQYANDNLTDPEVNASDAYEIYNSGGFTRWSTYNNGKYLNYLAQAQAGV